MPSARIRMRHDKGKREPLDQYYTHPELAAQYVRSLYDHCDPDSMVFMEPAAGTGAFTTSLIWNGLRVTSVDIDPKMEGITKGDFLEDDLFPDCGSLAVVGNPPFGWAASTAIRFFNRAAERAEIIAFIVPRTFRKLSVQDKLDRRFWLAHDEDVPPMAFVRGGKPHDVPCAWQIWEKRETPREYVPTPDVSHIITYTEQNQADFGFRRVGWRAGSVLPLDNGQFYSESTTFFIKQMHENARELLAQAGMRLRDVGSSTIGVRSISKREVALELAKGDL